MKIIHFTSKQCLVPLSLAIACVCTAAAEGLTGLAYRGWSNAGNGAMAVVVRDGREQIVSVGDTVDEKWKVIAIDREAVTVQHVSAGLRQQVWFGGGVSQAVPESSVVPRSPLRMTWNAPSMVQPGSEFSVTFSFPGLEIRNGVITMEYDPEVLVLTDATGEWEDHRGRAELKIADAGEGERLAELAFRVATAKGGVTSMRLARLTGLSATGEPLATPEGNDLRIAVGSPSADSLAR